jgi:hypothetical protein
VKGCRIKGGSAKNSRWSAGHGHEAEASQEQRLSISIQDRNGILSSWTWDYDMVEYLKAVGVE